MSEHVLSTDTLRKVIMLLLVHYREVTMAERSYTEYSNELGRVIKELRILIGDDE